MKLVVCIAEARGRSSASAFCGLFPAKMASSSMAGRAPSRHAPRCREETGGHEGTQASTPVRKPSRRAQQTWCRGGRPNAAKSIWMAPCGGPGTYRPKMTTCGCGRQRSRKRPAPLPGTRTGPALLSGTTRGARAPRPPSATPSPRPRPRTSQVCVARGRAQVCCKMARDTARPQANRNQMTDYLLYWCTVL